MGEFKEIIINGTKVEPGQTESIKLHVGKLPSGTRIVINAFVFRSKDPGPTILLMAGMHGDEINGVEILRRAVNQNMFENLSSGTVIVIPLLNIFGFVNFSRFVPDGKDVNRSFPGNMSGSLAARMARVVTKKVLPLIDFGVDFHTGASSRFNFPQVRYSRKDKFAAELARQFGAPFMIEKGLIPKSFRKISSEMGKSVLVYEAGEALRFDGFSIQKGLEGIQRLLYAQNMHTTTVPQTNKIIPIKRTGWIRASFPGLFIWNKSSGQRVVKNELLGFIHDPYGNRKVRVLATRPGYLIGHTNACVVNQGDALFHIGFEGDNIEK